MNTIDLLTKDQKQQERTRTNIVEREALSEE